jgi:hypothetical protein
MTLQVAAPAAICAFALVTASCGSSRETTSHASSKARTVSTEDRRRTLQTVSLPDASAAGAAVQRQLGEGYT